MILICVISAFRRRENEICALLASNAAQIGSLLPTFQDNLSVPYSRAKQSNNTVNTGMQLYMKWCG